MKVFCIDGVVVEIDYEPTYEDMQSQAFMPKEKQPIMAAVVPEDINLLSPMDSLSFIKKFGGVMVGDINTETVRHVARAFGREWED